VVLEDENNKNTQGCETCWKQGIDGLAKQEEEADTLRVRWQVREDGGQGQHLMTVATKTRPVCTQGFQSFPFAVSIRKELGCSSACLPHQTALGDTGLLSLYFSKYRVQNLTGD
jgi:hypothetical protein